mgnify:CR=1 FL=1
MIPEPYGLGFWPTPLHRLLRLEAEFPGVKLYIKRDDQSGLATGGNKTRKLEYLLGDALARGADTVITGGAQQSNHCRQTGAACAQAGLACHLALGGASPETMRGNLLLSHLLGAQLHFCGAHRKGEAIPDIIARLEQEGRKVYPIPYGGSNAFGALGFVNAYEEFAAQCHAQNIAPDYLFFASSSGGTQAGLSLGKAMTPEPQPILMPVSIDKEESADGHFSQKVAVLCREAASLLGWEGEVAAHETTLIEGYDRAGYGQTTEAEWQSIRLLARTEGVLLDPVYSGRAFHAMGDMLHRQLIRPGKTVVFWHTGGIPALFC